MKQISSTAVWVAVAAAVLFAGCSRKTDTKTALEKTVSELAATEAAQPPSAPAPGSPSPASVNPATPATAPASLPSQQMRQAVSSYNAGNFEDAVILKDEAKSY